VRYTVYCRCFFCTTFNGPPAAFTGLIYTKPGLAPLPSMSPAMRAHFLPHYLPHRYDRLQLAEKEHWDDVANNDKEIRDADEAVDMHLDYVHQEAENYWMQELDNQRIRDSLDRKRINEYNRMSSPQRRGCLMKDPGYGQWWQHVDGAALGAVPADLPAGTLQARQK
jgi:hypothetical protein